VVEESLVGGEVAAKESCGKDLSRMMMISEPFFRCEHVNLSHHMPGSKIHVLLDWTGPVGAWGDHQFRSVLMPE